MNSGDPDVIAKTNDACVAADLVFHTPVPDVAGVKALKRVWEILPRASPDIHVAVEETIAEGAKVVSTNTVSGVVTEVRGVSGPRGSRGGRSGTWSTSSPGSGSSVPLVLTSPPRAFTGPGPPHPSVRGPLSPPAPPD
ncbi:nuclear transport factor 2 family protein [Streptomyces sp. Qhu_M48]|uniref:nuclear transport factor 2 family protein n=1 Tax=Streptomyces sp. Qhu_M48 TaxID=3435889 RepID=UPI003F4FF744